LGSILLHHARDCEWHLQLVRFPSNLASDYTSQILTPNSQLLNEIMPMIYKRFTEKSAEEWRQIYKVQGIGHVPGNAGD
jgi:hypothetical protein